MKRYIIVFIMLFCGMISIAQNVNENHQNQFITKKALKKEIQKKAKQLKSAGWQPYIATENMKDIVRDIILAGIEDEKRLIVGIADSVVDLEEGLQAAFSDAIRSTMLEIYHYYNESDAFMPIELMEATEYEKERFECGDDLVIETVYPLNGPFFNRIQKGLREGYLHTLYRKTHEGVDTIEVMSFFAIDFDELAGIVEEDKK